MSDFSRFFDYEAEDSFVIDSNDRILQRLEEYQEEMAQKEIRDREELIQRFYDSLEYDEEGNPIIPTDEEGYALVPMDDEGNPLVPFDEEGNLIMPGQETEPIGADGEYPQEEYVEEEFSPDAQAVLEDAQAQAQMILEDAQAQAEQIFNNAKEEGINAGYDEGFAQAQQEFAARQQELEAERDRMLSEIRDMQASMESDLVDVICQIVDRTFNIMFSDNREIVLHLVDNALLNIENSRTFLIRVSEKNHAFILENKPKLMERVGSDVVLDIIMDPLMGEGGCIIETDGGVFDCSLDVELNNLTKSIKALS